MFLPDFTDDELGAIKRLSQNPDFEWFVNVCDNQAYALAMESTKLDGHRCYRHQGAARVLSELTAIISKSAEMLDLRRTKINEFINKRKSGGSKKIV